MQTDTAPNAAKPKPQRRWYQFGLRALLIFVTVAGCSIGWLGIKVQEARRQEAAVAAIQQLSAMVIYDYQYGHDLHDKSDIATPPGPLWLHDLLGDDFFRNVYEVDLGNTLGGQITDDNLKPLRGLRRLKKLDLYRAPVTDAGLEHLAGLDQLETLSLSYSRITDAGLRHLEGLAQLKQLELHNTQVTDTGLESLRGLTNLEELGLGETKITDIGLEYLQGLTQLKKLHLAYTQVTDAGVAKLQAALPHCQIMR
jgi:Leucine-rich repeat (LRR) protein